VWLVVNCKNGISSYEMARDLGVTQKSAWFMNHRIRLALNQGSFLLAGEVKVDETFIGGKARNMHVAQRRRRITGTGGKDKTPVLGMLERDGKVRTMVIADRKKKTLQGKGDGARQGWLGALLRRAALVRRARREVRASGD
jgi:hypothetical protein